MVIRVALLPELAFIGFLSPRASNDCGFPPAPQLFTPNYRSYLLVTLTVTRFDPRNAQDNLIGQGAEEKSVPSPGLLQEAASMNVRRTELAPVLLLLLAGAALELSWIVARQGATAAPARRSMASTAPSANRGELEWPAHRLPPLDLVTLDLGADLYGLSSYASSSESLLCLTPPQLSHRRST